MRLTKITCTLGPSSHTPEHIRELAKAGMNIARINFSHGSHTEHLPTIQSVQKVNKEDGRSIALMLDTKGCEIRTGDVKAPIAITKGQEVVFAFVEPKSKDRQWIAVSYAEFSEDVRKAETILVDNGTMSFDLLSIEKDGSVIARSNDDGEIGSRRHINLPGADISLPAMMEKDWSDIEFGIAHEMDFIALSFIRTADEVKEVADFLAKKKSAMKTIAKIETRQAVANIDAIIAVSDGIMVARGDLGAEMPFQMIPAIQDMIVEKCLQAGKPVIVATQMLESMIENPMPTRAEVTDIAHAATTRADATMLSGETAKGEHPLASVEAMALILQETEKHQKPNMRDPHRCPWGERSAMADAAVSMALAVQAPTILVCTRSGKSAQAVSQLRSNLPIVALTDTAAVQRSLQLCHAVTALVIDFDNDPEETILRALNASKSAGLITSGQKLVIISDTKTKGANVHGVHVRLVP